MSLLEKERRAELARMKQVKMMEESKKKFGNIKEMRRTFRQLDTC